MNRLSRLSFIRSAMGLLDSGLASSSSNCLNSFNAPSTSSSAYSPAPSVGSFASSFFGQLQQHRGYAQPLWKIHRRRAGVPVRGKHKRQLKVLLVKDFVDGPGHPKLGVAGSLVLVAPGYGRNFLIPQGYARYAVPKNLEEHRDLIESAKLRRQEQNEAVDQTALSVNKALTILDKVRVVFRRPVDPESEARDATTPSQAVTVEHVVSNTQRQLQVKLDPALVDLKEPLVKFGEYDVPLRMRVLGPEGEAQGGTPVVKVSLLQGRKIV